MRWIGLCLCLSACATRAPVSGPPTESLAAADVTETRDASDFIGDWWGELTVSDVASLRIALHIHEGPDGLGATMDSPDQGAMGLRASAVEIQGAAIVIQWANLGATYKAQRADGSLEGLFAQGAAFLPLVLEPGTVEAPQRPQEPSRPLPYEEMDVTIDADGHTLAGTLTLPAGEGPFPAVICITGSGPQDRDESLLGHRPFYVLADRLTRANIAVLRYDDRGVAASTGDFSSATTEDFAADAARAMQWLRDRPDIGSIGYLGHSEGGMVAPLAHRSAPSDFQVLLAAPAVPIVELMLTQQEAVSRASGMTEELATGHRDIRRAMLEAIAGGDSPEHRRIVRDSLAQLPGADGLGEAEIQRTLDQQFSPWWVWFAGHDPGPTFEDLQVPLFAAWGSLDVQVDAVMNREGLEQHATSSALTARIYEGLNHLFQQAQTGAPAEYASIEETMSEELMTDISTWILEQAP